MMVPAMSAISVAPLLVPLAMMVSNLLVADPLRLVLTSIGKHQH